MAAIAHAVATVTSNQTTTSTTYSNVSGASLADTNFTAGKKYLIIVTAQMGTNDRFESPNARVAHGGTAFADSEQLTTPVLGGANNDRYQYCWWTVWTAVSSEAITLQFARDFSNTTSADNVMMVAICLSDDVTENTDWFYTDDSGDDALTGSLSSGAAITFTPGTAAHDWLVLAMFQGDPNDSAGHIQVQITRSGEASSTVPSINYERSNDPAVATLARVFTLGASSNTFTEQALEAGVNFNRLHSRIFALDLNKFAAHGFAITDADTNLGTSSFATAAQTLSLDPLSTTDVVFGGYMGFDIGANSRKLTHRIQVDNTDEPTSQTGDAYLLWGGGNSTAECPIAHAHIASMSSGTRTIDWDAHADSTTSTPAVQHRTLWAFTTELAGGGGGGTVRPRSLLTLGVGC